MPNYMLYTDDCLTGAKFQVVTNDVQLKRTYKLWDSNQDCKEACKAERSFELFVSDTVQYYRQPPKWNYYSLGSTTITVAIFTEE